MTGSDDTLTLGPEHQRGPRPAMPGDGHDTRAVTTVAHELPRLRHDYPAWHVWASTQGRLYATRPGLSVLLPGASVTVDAATADGLTQAIAAAERDAGRAADLWEKRGYVR